MRQISCQIFCHRRIHAAIDNLVPMCGKNAASPARVPTKGPLAVLRSRLP